MIRGLLLLMLLAPAGPSLAAGAGSTGAVALKVPAGARPAAMGGAFVGLADDQNALFWNPAGLADIKAAEIGLMYTSFVVDTSYQLITYAQPAPALGGGFAAAINTMSYGTMNVTSERSDGLYGGVTGAVAPREWFLSGGWGTQLPKVLGLEHLRAGGTLKATFQPTALGEVMGLGGSAGVLWQSASGRLRAGTLADNLGALTSGAGLLPITWRAGASYRLPLGAKFALTGAGDGQLMIDTGWRMNAGAELLAFDVLALRGGWSGGDQLQPAGPTLGAGLRAPTTWFGRSVRLAVDWATAGYGDLGNTQRLQLTLQF